MKKYIIIAIALFLLEGIVSCSKYLDVQDDFSASDSVDFVLTDNVGQARRFHRYIYLGMPVYSAFSGANQDAMKNPWVNLSDEVFTNINGTMKNTLVSAYLSNSAPHHRWTHLYRIIRQCNIYLANAKPIGVEGESDSISEEEVKKLKAEALFFRAYAHYLLFEQYGPITVMKTVTLGSETAAFYERNSVDEVVQAIIEDLDEALSLNLDENRLSSSSASGFEDRRISIPTKGVALALKAKTLVLAASPLFNGGYTEALALVNKSGKRLFPDADPTKWVKAKEALEALLEYAEQGNYELYKSANNDPHLNVYEVFQKYNKEIIWANALQDWTNSQSAMTPRDIQVSTGNAMAGYLSVPQEMVDSFFMNNGLKIDDSGSGYTETGFSNVLNPATLYIRGGKAYRLTDPDISNMYANREPRFYAAITYHGKSWHDVASFPSLQNNNPNLSKVTRVFFSKDINSTPLVAPGYREKASSNNSVGGYPNSGYILYKFVNRTVHPFAGGRPREAYRPSIIFRLADFYLLYAEVLNEINPSDTKIVEYLDKIRERAGIPGYQQMQNNGTKVGVIGNQAAMRAAIQHERKVELFAEGQRYFDVRRWMIADQPSGRQGGFFTGMNMNGNHADGTYFQRVNISQQPHIFERKMYLYPIPLHETQFSYQDIVQNPGW